MSSTPTRPLRDATGSHHVLFLWRFAMKNTHCARPEPAQDIRTGLSPAAIRQAFRDNLFFLIGRVPGGGHAHDRFMALAYTVRDRLLHHWIRTAETYRERRSRTVAIFRPSSCSAPNWTAT